MLKKTLFFLFFCSFHTAFSQTTPAHQLLRQGDNAYKKSDFTAAEEKYRKAQENQTSDKATYNLGNAIYQQNRYEEAQKQYSNALQNAKTTALQAKAAYNLGNAYFQQKQYDKSISSYKKALRQNPNDIDTKKNLALAQQQLRQQQQQKQNQNDKKENKEKSKEQNKDQQEPAQEQQQQQKEPQQQDIEKQEAQQMLKIMDEEEKKVQQRLKKGKPTQTKSGKDW